MSKEPGSLCRIVQSGSLDVLFDNMISPLLLINVNDINIIVNQELKAKVPDALELALQLAKRVQRSNY